VSLDFDVNCLCNCTGEAPSGGMRLIRFRNVQPADLLRFRAAAKAGQITAIICPTCDCEHKLDDDGSKVVTISTSRPQIRGIGPNQGARAGGYDVSIYGHALDDPGLVVLFNGVAATNLRNKTDQSVTVTAPPGANNGPVDVVVAGKNGQHPTNGTLVKSFTYIA